MHAQTRNSRTVFESNSTMAEFTEFTEELTEEVERSLQAAERAPLQGLDTNSPAASPLGSSTVATKVCAGARAPMIAEVLVCRVGRSGQ
jgi:hypothetical protein